MSESMNKPADDLEILAPDRQIVIGGEKLTVRELRFGEQIAHHAALAAMGEALRPVIDNSRKSEGGSADDLTLILDALAEHTDVLVTMMALSVDKPREWIAALTGDEGEALTLTWWSVNQGFFIRRLLRPLMLQEAKARLSIGGVFSQPSSVTDTPVAN